MRYTIRAIGFSILVSVFTSCFFDKDLKQDSHIQDFRNQMLRVLDSLDNPNDRIKAFESILEQIEKDKDMITERKKKNIRADGLFYICNEYYDMQQFDKMLELCNEILKLNPQNAEAYYNRGVAYQAKNESEKALNDYTKTIDLNENYTNAYYNRALLYEKDKKFNLALDDYNKTIKLKPAFIVDAYIGRGNSHRGLNMADKAMKDYSKAIEMDSLNVEAHSNMGSILVESGEYEKALNNYSFVMGIDSTNIDLYNKLGYTYELMKDYKKALDSYQKVLNYKPDSIVSDEFKELAKDGITRVKQLKNSSRK